MKQLALASVMIFLSVFCSAQQTSVCTVDVNVKYRMTCVSINNQSFFLVDSPYVESMLRFAPDLLVSLLNGKEVAVSVNQRLDDSMKPDMGSILVFIGKSIVLHFHNQLCVTGFPNQGLIYGKATFKDGMLHVFDCSWVSGNQRSSC